MTDKATHTPLPCPFCGDVPPKTLHETRFGERYLQCACCEARGPTSFTDPLTAWNTRADSHHRLVEALEALLYEFVQSKLNGGFEPDRIEGWSFIQDARAALKEAGR